MASMHTYPDITVKVNDKTEKQNECCACSVWYLRTCVLCIVTCIFVIGCCVYCSWLMVQMNEIKQKCLESHEHGAAIRNKDLANNGDTMSYNADRFEDSAVYREKRKADKSRKPKRKGKKAKAAHYGSYVKDANMDTFLPGYDAGKLTNQCKFITEMKGTLCRSKDFITNSSTGTLHLFKKADWVDKKYEPFKLKENGLFEAKYPGVYLIYAQVVFHTEEESLIITIAQNRPSQKGTKPIQELACYENGDNTKDPRYTSCGVTGLFYLKKGDVLSIQNFYNVHLNLKEAGTYFGGVLLK